MIEQGETIHNRLEIDLAAQRLTAWENDRIVLQAPCSTDPTTKSGQYKVQERTPGGIRQYIDNHPNVFHGVPWVIALADNQQLTGVYWHNRFGSPVPGASIQVTPLLAQWLFNWLGDESTITIH